MFKCVIFFYYSTFILNFSGCFFVLVLNLNVKKKKFKKYEFKDDLSNIT